jgi:hypothetical protein
LLLAEQSLRADEQEQQGPHWRNQNSKIAEASKELRRAMKWLNGVSLAATFEGEFSAVTRSYAGKGVASPAGLIAALRVVTGHSLRQSGLG